jgi:Dcp1-like decapping family
MLTSDYESDAAHYMESRPPPAPQLLHRTNTELNLSVLQHYLPSITSIVSIAANAVVYTFAPETQEWDKAGVEGTLFVCDQEPSPVTGAPRACVFVLNRRGLDNIILDLAKVGDCEVTEQLLIFRLEDGVGAWEEGAAAGNGGTAPGLKIMGLWIHADEDDTRETNGALIYNSWKAVREATQNANRTLLHGFEAKEESVGPAMQAMGRKLSITEIFGRQVGGGGS